MSKVTRKRYRVDDMTNREEAARADAHALDRIAGILTCDASPDAQLVGISKVVGEVREVEPAVKHRHTYGGQTLVHSHEGGGTEHGYFGHPEDPATIPDQPDEWEVIE